MGDAVKWLGIVLFGIGFVLNCTALAFVAPGRSRVVAMFRGSFERQDDYTPAGWRLLTFARRLTFIGLGLALAAIFLLGAE